MDAVTFVKEYRRLCDEYPACIRCPLGKFEDCVDADPEEMVKVVEKWSKEHPVVTNGKKMLELIAGEASQWESGGTLNGMVEIRVSKKWWDAEYKGEQ